MTSTNRSVAKDYAWLFLFWAAATAYNLFKPYHIDDSAHLQFAQTFMAHPLHPMTSTLNLGGAPEPIWHHNQPPLYFYLLGLWGSVFGYTEPATHALGALFAGAAIVLFYRIACVLTPIHALWLTGMMALGPAFIIGQNLMVDVPLLAIWLLFFDALIAGAGRPEQCQRRRFLIAAGAASAAVLVKYSSLVLFPILGAVLVVERRWRLLWIAGIPVAALAAWSLFNLIEYRHIHMLQRPMGVARKSWTLPVMRFVSIVVTIGGLTPLGLLVAVRLVPWFSARARAVYGAGVFVLVLLALVAATGVAEGPVDTALRLCFLINGILILLGVCAVVIRRLSSFGRIFVATPDKVRLLILLLWVAGHFGFYSLFAPFMAARHVLLVLPALLLLCAMPWPVALPRLDAAVGLALTVAVTVMTAWADWRFAAFFRDGARSVVASLPAGSRIWFYGGWGWQWYAHGAGMTPVNTDNSQMRPGDFLVTISDDATPRALFSENRFHLQPMTLVRTDSKPAGLRDLFCTARYAHFYGVGYSWLPDGPWMLTNDCRNELDIYRVN